MENRNLQELALAEFDEMIVEALDVLGYYGMLLMGCNLVGEEAIMLQTHEWFANDVCLCLTVRLLEGCPQVNHLIPCVAVWRNKQQNKGRATLPIENFVIAFVREYQRYRAVNNLLSDV